ncbi:MAG: hypothetical protein AB1489_17840 [Acidobacteriota bacterium]
MASITILKKERKAYPSDLIVHSADIMDRDGAHFLFEKALKDFPTIKLIWVDDGYRSNDLKEWIKNNCPWSLEFVRRPSPRRIVGSDLGYQSCLSKKSLLNK